MSVCVCVCAQSCPTLCDSMDCGLPGSSAHGILQARYWNGLLFPIPRDIPKPVIEPGSPADPLPLVGRSFTTETPGNAHFPTRMLFNLEQSPLFL